jgi:DNA (cytosine-5)-methyltransferase 1
MSQLLQAISLFSGCGGDTLGLERAGFKVVAFNEFKKFAIDTHTANFPHSVLLKDGNNSDITKVPDSAFTPYVGKVQIVFAGFPCQGFSNAGKKNSADPRNQMFRQFLRVAKIVRPQFIIGENVTGLATMKSGPNETDPLMIDIICKEFREIGYQLYYKVLEATDFGVPQKRKRIILVGWNTWLNHNEQKPIKPESFWASVTAFGSRLTKTSMADFVTNSMEDAHLIPEAFVPNDFPDYALKVDELSEPTGQPHPYVILKSNTDLLSCYKRVSPIHSEIIDVNRPSKTIISTYDHQPRLLVGLRKPNGASYCRTLFPQELKQIQGFPADFILTGSKKDQVTQIGNAVPPPVIHSIASCLKDILEA